MKKEKEFKVGDLHHWEGSRNSDTGTIDGGYLYFVTKIGTNDEGRVFMEMSGKSVRGVSNRSQAIKKYKEQLQ